MTIPPHVLRMFDTETTLREKAIAYAGALARYRSCDPGERAEFRRTVDMAARSLRIAASEFDAACRRIPAVRVHSEDSTEAPQ